MDHYRALIGASDENEANVILDTLLTERVVAGGLITHGPSRFWWKGKIEIKEYYNISTFIPKHKKDILIEVVRKITSDETPVIALFPIEGNQDFLDWVDQSVL